MIELQCISRMLKTKSMSLVVENGIDADYFTHYPKEYEFIASHHAKYGRVPDIETFLAAFPNADVLDVGEDDDYLVNALREQHVYEKTAPILAEIADVLGDNSYDAVRLLEKRMPEIKSLIALKEEHPIDIAASAADRMSEHDDKASDRQKYYIPTGFQELDELIGGWNKGGEFAVILMRTSQGKSWLLQKFLTYAWEVGLRVGMFEPEMSTSMTGYRFDTLHGHLSNLALTRGSPVDGYREYVYETQTHDNPFYLMPHTSHPDVSDIRRFIEDNELDIMGIDGISYIRDARHLRSDNLSTTLTHVSEDLMSVSIKLDVPILAVVQSNRGDSGGTLKDKFPSLYNVRDSDGIAFNATVILSGYHSGNVLHLKIAKSRGGMDNKDIAYHWDIDKGTFEYMPDADNARDAEKTDALRREYAQDVDMDVF